MKQILAEQGGWVILASAALLTFLLTFGVRVLNKQAHPLAVTLRATRNLIVPTTALLYYFLYVLNLPLDSRLIKIFQTVLGIEVIWVLLSLVKVFLFSRTQTNNWRSRVPGLLVDIIRFAMVVVGGAFVIAGVWDRDLGAFLATLGVGSIVLGLALQDTLGSLMAGIALLIERPFAVDDWIKVGDVLGKVTEINWRSVRVCTRDNDIIIVPNSVLGKERIQNCSRPDPVHGVLLYIGFSYDDPPNKVKHILVKTALSTPDVLQHPSPSIRTKQYQDFSIQYEIKFWVHRFDRLPEIESDLMTKIWYAARRNHLTIPYPIRTIFKSDAPPPSVADPIESIREAIRAVPLFATLTSEEVDTLARDAAIRDFAPAETIVKQGDPGDALYIIKDGHAAVTIKDNSGKDKEVAQCARFDFFGEMSLLSGEMRTASVTAKDDMDAIVIYKDALATLLERRPDLAQEMAVLVERRRQGLSDIKDRDLALLSKSGVSDEKTNALLGRIKQFFGMERV